MKAQASLEQLVVIAAALAFITIAFYLAANYSSDSVKIAQSQDAVERLAAGADHVYALGPNSKDYVTVYLPEDLMGASVTGKRVMISVPTSGKGTTDVFAYSKADLVGSLPHFRGKQKIMVEYLASGKVRIGEAGLDCEPPYITRTFNAGDTGSDTIAISNNADFDAVNITAKLTGATTLASIGSPTTPIAAGSNGTLAVSYNIPANASGGAYSTIAEVDSTNGGSCITQITINVNGLTNCADLCGAQGYTNGFCRQSALQCNVDGADYHSENDYSCTSAPTGPKCCCFPSVDDLGPLVKNMSSTPYNASAISNVTIDATCDDTGRGNSFIASAQMQLDFGAWANMSAASGTSFSTQVVQNVYQNVGQLIPGQHIAAAKCTDSANNTGPVAYYYFNITMADVLGPIITSMNHSDASSTTLVNITEYCTATELYTGNANIVSCSMRVDNGLWQAALPVDGNFDSPNEQCYYNVGMLASGTHTVYAKCTDALNNTGGEYNDTFGISAGDMMLILDRSGSMSEPVTNVFNNNAENSVSSSFTYEKSLTLPAKNGDPANVSVEMYVSRSGCTGAFEARVNGTVISAGNTTSTLYTTVTKNGTLAGFTPPITVDLYLKKIYGSSCTVYNRNFGVTQLPTKMDAVQASAKTFVDILSNSTQAGLVSYSTSAITNKQLANMTSSAKTTLKNAIDALSPSGNTCIGCGIQNAVNELISARSRYPDAVRVAILLTDGQTNVEPPTTTDASANARDNHVVIYTIGFGVDVDSTELTNIAMLTGGKYYYAPDAATLTCIFQHIGQTTQC